jgi:hypothetical protein
MAARDDFLIKVTVDQERVSTYLRELGDLPARLKSVETQLRRAGNGRIYFPANSDPVIRAARRQAEMVRKGRESTYTSMQRLSVELQADVGKRLEGTYVRKSAASGALERLTMSERNRDATKRFFGVGDVNTLANDRKVHYALAIEAGTKKHLGRRLVGIWMGPGGAAPFGPPTAGQQFVRMSLSAARSELEAAGREGKVSGIIRHEILPHRAYRKATQYFRPQAKMADAIRRAYGFK